MRPITVALLVAVIATTDVARGAQTPRDEHVDAPAIQRIRDEGLNRSQVMDTVFWLSDRYGPRLNGSTEFEEAGEWAMERLRAWGARHVRKERFTSGRGWSLVRFHATMVEPRVMPIIGMPQAWTPGTNGLVSADVVRVSIANRADAEKYRGTLVGKIVLPQSARVVRMLEHGDGTVLRYDDREGKWRTEAMTPQLLPAAPRPAPAAPSQPAAQAPSPAREAPFDMMAFYRNEGVVAIFDRGPSGDLAAGGSDLSWRQQRLDGGTIVLQDGASPYAEPSTLVPQVTLAVEHYNRMVRLLDRGIPVKVEINLATRFREETRPNGFNVIGEIPGTDKADEVVVLGAHFDSWHGATGATDNATGSAAVLEVLRIFTATGLRPRRTVRFALWGSEENGLVGSRTYVREHLGTPAMPKPALARTAAYFNLDNGTGKIRGVWMQGNASVASIFAAWSVPLNDLGVDLLSPRRVSQTDHVPFDAVGVPAFQFVQERYEYNSRTHHTNMDFYDRVQADDMKQMATVAAVFVWHAATREAMLPRASRGGADRQ